MLWFVTDSQRPGASTLRIVSALAAVPGIIVLVRDKRLGWDERLLADVAACTPRLIVNVGPESAARALALGALGWHAPEAVWQGLPAGAPGLVSLADHDGTGLRYARAQAVPAALVSPIWIEKGRAARGLAAFDPSSPVRQIALGGVRSPRESELALASGAAGVAVQRALYESVDPHALAVALLAPFVSYGHAYDAATLLSR